LPAAPAADRYRNRYGSARSITGVIARFVVELIIPATIVGGLIGWWLGERRRL
jgi:hypothetical protein